MAKFAEQKYGRKRAAPKRAKGSAMDDYEIYLRSVRSRIKTAEDKVNTIMRQKKVIHSWSTHHNVVARLLLCMPVKKTDLLSKIGGEKCCIDNGDHYKLRNPTTILHEAHNFFQNICFTVFIITFVQ